MLKFEDVRIGDIIRQEDSRYGSMKVVDVRPKIIWVIWVDGPSRDAYSVVYDFWYDQEWFLNQREEEMPHADGMASQSSLIKKSKQAYMAILRQAIDVAVTALQAIETDGGSGFAEMTATTALQRIREILE